MRKLSSEAFLHLPLQSKQKREIGGYYLEEVVEYGALATSYRVRAVKTGLQVPGHRMMLFDLEHLSSRQARINFRKRFSHEAQQWASLQHPSVQPLTDFGSTEEFAYLLTPTFEGEALIDRLRQRRRWTPAAVLALLSPLASALSYLHNQGLVYQFLHPAHILFLPTGNVQLLKSCLAQMTCICGLVEMQEVSPYAHLQDIAGNYLGAPAYLAPETVTGGRVDRRADVYALGSLLFELLSGQPLFTGKEYLDTAQKHCNEPLPSLREIIPDFPVALELVINRSLYYKPEMRYQSVDELMKAYTRVLKERIQVSRQFYLVEAIEQISTQSVASSLPYARPASGQDATNLFQHDQFLLGNDDNLFHKEPEFVDGSVSFGGPTTGEQESVNRSVSFAEPTTEKRRFSPLSVSFGGPTTGEQETLNLSHAPIEPVTGEHELTEEVANLLARVAQSRHSGRKKPPKNVQEMVVPEATQQTTHREIASMAQNIQRLKSKLQARSEKNTTFPSQELH